MIKYNYKDYCEDIEKLTEYIKNIGDYNLYVIHRGSLVIGAHLSNILNTKLGIIRFQSRDGDDKVPIIINNIGTDNMIIIDDIFDSGLTYDKCKDVFDCKFITIFKASGVREPDYYLRDNNDWVSFWWEREVENCKQCIHSEPCNKYINSSHCNLVDRTFPNDYVCAEYKQINK